jgi:pilus assembly protein CpaE
MNIKLLTTLPPSGMARLKMMNSGESLFECAPRDPYTQSIKKMAKSLAVSPQGSASDNTQSGWLSRVFASKVKNSKVTV